MRLFINIPIKKSDIFKSGVPIKVAKRRGDRWSRKQLGDFADRSGVYVLHNKKKILYVGKTTSGTWGVFGERLRREFQFTSSSNSHLHNLLARQKKKIYAYIIDFEKIEKIVRPKEVKLQKEKKALVLEQCLIGIFNPEGNRE